MADNSVMHNIGAVENYGKNLANVGLQMVETFKKLKQQTDYTRSNWNDEMFNTFRQKFDEEIMKKVQEISVTMEVFSKYVEKMCELHRMTQNQRYY